MRVYSEQEPIPAAVVTLATQEDNKQHILFQTRYDVEGFYTVAGEALEDSRKKYASKEEPCPEKLMWAIKALSVSLFRDWSTSQARITLICNVKESKDNLPRLPRVNQFRGGQYPYLTIDDEIRIYAGYVASAVEPISANMLDDVPFPLQKDTIVQEGTQRVRKKIDIPGVSQPNFDTGKLVPIFWGFIDKMDYDANEHGGHQVILSCRDRVRVLSDTTLINIPSLNGVFGSSGSVALPQGRLSAIAADVAKAVNGYQINIADDAQESLNCWKRILTPNMTVNEDQFENENRQSDNSLRAAAAECEYYSAWDASDGAVRKSSTVNEDTADPSIFVRRASFKPMDILSRPRFHMWLSRPPLAKNNKKAQWQVLNQTPLKIIKWIATKEERSMDFFASHVNGDFCLVPRVLDISGFEDPLRMYRTYFFRNFPRITQNGKPLEPPCKNQLILSIRAHTSIVGTFNRFTIVDNSNVAGAGLAVLEGVKLTVDRVPFILDGNAEEGTERKPSPPCRQKLIFDGSLGTYANSFGGALIVAQSVSAQLARDVSGVEFVVLGDPTFYPGEAVRVYNTFLHDTGFVTQTGQQQDILDKEAALDSFQERWNDENPDSASVKAEDRALANEQDARSIGVVQEVGTQATSIEDLRLPVYKIRSIEHRIKTTGRNAGYTTVVSAAMDLNN